MFIMNCTDAISEPILHIALCQDILYLFMVKKASTSLGTAQWWHDEFHEPVL